MSVLKRILLNHAEKRKKLERQGLKDPHPPAQQIQAG